MRFLAFTMALITSISGQPYSRRPVPSAAELPAWLATEFDNVSRAIALALPAEGRTTTSLSDYLANNAVLNVLDFGTTGTADDTSVLQAAANAAPPEVVGSTLLLNGEFEGGTTSWTPSSTDTLASVAGGHAAPGPTNCLQITRASATTAQTATQALSALTAGLIYRVAFYVESGTSGDEWFAVSVASTGTDKHKTYGTTSGAWKRYSFVFKADGTENQIVLKKNTATAGTMLFDGVKLDQVKLSPTIVLVPPGLFNVTTLSLPSGVTLYLQGTLVSITDPALQTPTQSPYSQSTHPTILVSGQTDVRVTGSGTIIRPKYEAVLVVSSSGVAVDGPRIVGERLNDLTYDGIRFFDSADVSARNCDVSQVAGTRTATGSPVWGTGISAINCDHAEVSDNELHELGMHGSYFLDTFDITYVRNKNRNVAGDGVFLNKSVYTTRPMGFLVDDSTFDDIGGDCVDVTFAGLALGLGQDAAGTISNNRMRNVGYLPDMTAQQDGVGMCTIAGASNVTVTGNKSNRSSQQAVRIDDASDIVLNGNQAKNCQDFVTFGHNVSKVTINGGLVTALRHLMVVGVGGTASRVSVNGGDYSIAGFPIDVLGSASDITFAPAYVYIDPAAVTGFGTVTRLKLLDATYEGKAVSLSQAGAIVKRNTFRESVNIADSSDMNFGDNRCHKGLDVRRTSTSNFSDNFTNLDKGDFAFTLPNIGGANDKLTLNANICYKDVAGDCLVSTATNSKLCGNIAADGGAVTYAAAGTVLIG